MLSELFLSFLIWLFVGPAMELWKGQGHVTSATILGWLVVLSICLLGGYLSAKWRWDDLLKKFPEDCLPPGE